MACVVPYDKLKDLFFKSLAYDYETYRHYRNSVKRIMTMPLSDEAKVHSIWFMGLLYNEALKSDSNLTTEGLPLKISVAVIDDLFNDQADFSSMLNKIDSIITDKEESSSKAISTPQLTKREQFNAMLQDISKAKVKTLNNAAVNYETFIENNDFDNATKLTLYRKLNEALHKKPNSSIKTAWLSKVESIIKDLEKPIPIGGVIDLASVEGIGKDIYLIRQPNGSFIETTFKEGKYYPIDSETGVVSSAEYKVDPNDYIFAAYPTTKNLSVTNNNGDKLRINNDTSSFGMRFFGVRQYPEGITAKENTDNRTGIQKIADNLRPGISIEDQIQVVADKRRIALNKARLARIQQEYPEVTIETSIRPSQVAQLRLHPEKPVLAYAAPIKGLQLTVQDKDDNKVFDYLSSLDTLVFVYSNNKVVAMDWSNPDHIKMFKELAEVQHFIKDKGYVYGQPTDTDIANITAGIRAFKNLKREISDMMTDEDEYLVIPSEVVRKHINISNIYTYLFNREGKRYIPQQSLREFKNTLIQDGSTIRTRIGRVDGDEVTDIRTEDIVGIIRKNNITGFEFDTSLPEGYVPIDENDKPISLEKLFTQYGFDRNRANNQISKINFGTFYLAKSNLGDGIMWMPKIMQYAGPIASDNEIVKFMIALTGAKDFKPSYRPGEEDAVVDFIHLFNNYGWGFNTLRGMIANVEFIKTIKSTNEDVYGITFRADETYPYANEFNDKKIKIEFTWDAYKINKEISKILDALGLSLEESNTLEKRLQLGQAVAAALEKNKEAVGPDIQNAISTITAAFKKSTSDIYSTLQSIKEKHDKDVATGKSERYLDEKRTFDQMLFTNDTDKVFKLRSREVTSDPLDNYKVFEADSSSIGAKRVVITPAKISASTKTASTREDSKTPSVKPKEEAVVETPTKVRNVIRNNNRLMLVEALGNLPLLDNEQFNKEIEDIKRMLGTDITVTTQNITNPEVNGIILGMFVDKAITLNNTYKVAGVAYHEAFHAIFRTAFTNEDRAKYFQLVDNAGNGVQSDEKGKYIVNHGTRVYFDKFRQDRAYYGLDDDTIANLIREEVLADGYRDYKLNNREPKNALLKFLYTLLDKIIQYLGTSKMKASLQLKGLYANIDKGGYSNVVGDPYNAPIAYELAEVPSHITKEGDVVLTPIDNNTNDQLKNRVLYELFKRSKDITKDDPISFNTVYDEVTASLIEEFRIENNPLIINDENEELRDAILDKYGNMFDSMRFILGAFHRTDVDNEVFIEGLDSSFNPVSEEVFNNFRNTVQEEYNSVELNDKMLDRTDDEEEANSQDGESDQDDEIRSNSDESEVGEHYEDDGITTYKITEGNAAFKRLFRYIKYTYTDPTLKVSFSKMVNSKNITNSVRKITNNTTKEDIIPSIDRHVEALTNTIDAFYNSELPEALGFIPTDMVNLIEERDMLKATTDTIKEIAALTDDGQVTREDGRGFYNMFHQVFYGSKAEFDAISINTEYDNGVKTPEGISGYINRVRVVDLSLRNDMRTIFDEFRSDLNIATEMLTNPEQIELYQTVAQLLNGYKYKTPLDYDAFTKQVNGLYLITSLMRLNIPRNLIEFSIAANVRETSEDEYTFVDDILSNDAEQYYAGNYLNMSEFTKALSEYFKSLSKGEKAIESKLDILADSYKNATAFLIKYNPALVGTQLLNQDGKTMSQVIPFTPNAQILLEIRKNGLAHTLNKYYPGFGDWFRDNPFLKPIFEGYEYNPEDTSAEARVNDILSTFFDSMSISVAAGMYQNINGKRINKTTYKALTEKSYVISAISLFSNRTLRASNGYGDTIELFKRPITQLEATSTQFNITGLYVNYTGKNAEANIKRKFLQMMEQEFNRIRREWASRYESKQRFENFNARTLSYEEATAKGVPYGTVVTDDPSLRAYNFRYFIDFFERNAETATALQYLLDGTKSSDLSFSAILEQQVGETTLNELLSKELLIYGNDTIADFKDYLKSLAITEDDLPVYISYDNGAQRKYLNAYSKGSQESPAVRKVKESSKNKQDFITDFVYNYWFNSLFVNQLFDGDMAVGISSFVDYFKRQKAAVAAGPNYVDVSKIDHENQTRVAILQDLKVYFDKLDLETPQTTDSTTGLPSVSVADGQAWININRKINKFDKDGLINAKAKTLLKRLRYDSLTFDEKQYLMDSGLVLNSDKPVFASPIFYGKCSEHLLIRSDVSHVRDKDLPIVSELYDRLDGIPLSNSEERKALIREIHSYFTPLPNRALLHHFLNSMEYHDVDALMDTNVSKKGTPAPLVIDVNKLEQDIRTDHLSMIINDEQIPTFENDYINLEYSQFNVPNDLVYEQVRTSRVTDQVVDSIQEKILLTSQLNTSEFKHLKGTVDRIKQLEDEIATSRIQIVSNLFNESDPSTLIAKIMQSGLASQGASPNMLKYFAIDPVTGKNKFNLNLPVLGKAPLYYFFSVYNKNIFGPKVPGKKFIHVSSLGYKLVIDEKGEIVPSNVVAVNPAHFANYETRYPKATVKNGVLTVEVIIPRELAKTPQEVMFFEKLYSEFLGSRIPTEAHYSMVSVKVVDRIDALYGNSIIVPQIVHTWAGSDMDIDALYAKVYGYYRNSLGELVKYGDYSSYTSKGITLDEAKFIEFLHHVAEDPAFDELIAADKLRLKNEEGYRQRSLTQGAKAFGSQIAKFFDRSQEELAILLGKDSFKDLTKGKSVTVSVKTPSVEKGKKAKTLQGFEALGKALNAQTVGVGKQAGKILKIMDRMISVVNVLNQYKLPSTPSALKVYSNKNGNPVTQTLINEVLTLKKNVLSDPAVYDTFIKTASPDAIISEWENDKELVNEISSFKNLKKANPFTPQSVSRVRALNSAAKTMVGANANSNKGFAVLATAGITLTPKYTYNFTVNDKKVNTNKIEKGSLRNVNGSISVATDDGKKQILGPLKFSLSNSAISNTMFAYGYDAQFTRIIHSVGAISETLDDYRLTSDPTYQGVRSFQTSFASFMNNRVRTLIDENKDALKLAKLLDPDPDRPGSYVINNNFQIEYTTTNEKFTDNSPSAMGIKIRTAKGKILSDELANVVLLSFYNRMRELGNAISFKITPITNTLKALRPSFDSVRRIKDSVEFINNNEIFENSTKIFKTYPALETLADKALKNLIDTSKEVLLDETNLFKGITSLFNVRYDSNLNEDQIVTELKSIFGMSALNAFVNEALPKIDQENPTSKEKFIMALAKATTVDYWVNNTVENDILYLQYRFPDNTFLKSLGMRSPVYGSDKKILTPVRVATSLVGAKVTPESQDELINDFYQLLHNEEEEVYEKAVNIAVHGMIRDGAISRSGGYVKILAPELFSFLSDQLSLIQSSFSEADSKSKNKVTTYIKMLDDVFSKIYRKKVTSSQGMQAILTKLVATVTMNIGANPQLRMSFWEGSKAFPQKGAFGDVDKQVFASILDEIMPKNASSIYKTDSSGKISPNTNLKLTAGVKGGQNSFELWRADANGELYFDMNPIENFDDTNKKITKRVLNKQGIYQTRSGLYGFPLYQINNYENGQLFLLQEIDGKPFTEDFFKNLFESHKNEEPFEMLLRGKTAKYKIIERQGVDKIKPNAFTNKTAVDIRNIILGKKSVTNSKVEKEVPLPDDIIIPTNSSSLVVKDPNTVQYIKGKSFYKDGIKYNITNSSSRYRVMPSKGGMKIFRDGKLITDNGRLTPEMIELANKAGYTDWAQFFNAYDFWLKGTKTSSKDLFFVSYTTEVPQKSSIVDITDSTWKKTDNTSENPFEC
jgi:hypothetical protein